MAKIGTTNIHSAQREMEKLNKILGEMNFESVDELNAFVEKNVKGKKIDDVIKKLKGKRMEEDKVTDLLDKAFASPPEKASKYIDQVLKLDPENPEALMFLSEQVEDPEKAIEIVKRGIESAKLKLGEDFFKENVGNFWHIAETRIFMRLMNSLGILFLSTNKRDKAMSVFSEMLRLNPNDNQGVRDLYTPFLVLERRYDEYRKLRKEYIEENSAVWNYLYSIYLFRTAGLVPKFYEALKKAYKENPHFVHITVGIETPPEINEYYTPGEPSEAIIAMDVLFEVIEDTPGYIYEFSSLPGLKEKIKSADLEKKSGDTKAIFPKAKYFCEYIGIFYIDLITKEGNGYFYFAVDAFSEYAFSLGMERELNDKIILEKIQKLITDAEFVDGTIHFNLVFGEFEHLESKILKIIKPVNGSLIFNKQFLDQISKPVIESFDELIENWDEEE